MNKLSTIVFALLSINVFSVRPLDRFDQWVSKFNIKIMDVEHRAHTISNWLSNDNYIEYINNKNVSYKLGHNHFSGMNSLEFKDFLGFDREFGVSHNQKQTLESTVPNQSIGLKKVVLPQ